MHPEQVSLDRFKRQVEAEWRHPLVAAAYQKWSAEEAEWGRACGEAIVERLELARGLHVCDIGSGHGEPGITIAQIVGPTGQVTLVDIAGDLLHIAGERATAAGLDNVVTKVADAHELPFDDSTFDRLSCRFAAMYFADYPRAFREAVRVLKPGGRAAYLVWGGMDQPIFRDVLGVLFQYVSPPEDEPGAPSPFMFSQPGTLSSALTNAGYLNVSEDTVVLPTAFPGHVEAWWKWFTDMAVPLQTLIASLSARDRERALSEILAALKSYYNGSEVQMPIEVVIASGQKSA